MKYIVLPLLLCCLTLSGCFYYPSSYSHEARDTGYVRYDSHEAKQERRQEKIDEALDRRLITPEQWGGYDATEQMVTPICASPC